MGNVTTKLEEKWNQRYRVVASAWCTIAHCLTEASATGDMYGYGARIQSTSAVNQTSVKKTKLKEAKRGLVA